MKPHLPILVVIGLSLAACDAGKERTVPQVGFEDLETLLRSADDTVYVINFWATWCKPCVEELPGFERLNREYRGANVRIVLVSLDFPNRYEGTLLPFLEEHGIACEVVHLTDVNANNWIDSVDPSWSGAIPATLIYRGNDREFFERKLDYGELSNIVKQKIED